MRTRLRFLFLLGALLCSAWPGTLLAYAPSNPPPQASSRPSFLLVATRRLTDIWFRQSVVLVARHGRSGPIGIILNRPLDTSLDKAFPAYPAAKDHKFFAGGPVFPAQVSYLFRSEQAAIGTLQVSDRVQLASEPSLLGKLLGGAHPHTGLRVVTGLAAWAPGQLENEIARGDWFVLPIDESAIFDLPATGLWNELHRRIVFAP